MEDRGGRLEDNVKMKSEINRVCRIELSLLDQNKLQWQRHKKEGKVVYDKIHHI